VTGTQGVNISGSNQGQAQAGEVVELLRQGQQATANQTQILMWLIWAIACLAFPEEKP